MSTGEQWRTCDDALPKGHLRISIRGDLRICFLAGLCFLREIFEALRHMHMQELFNSLSPFLPQIRLVDENLKELQRWKTTPGIL
jgi:hypothetical protein